MDEPLHTLERDRPAPDDDEIIVTPEMIEAGAQALWDRTYLAEFPKPADRLCVKEILEAALRARLISR